MCTEYRYLCGVSLFVWWQMGGHQCPRHYQRMAGLLRSHRWLLWTGNTPLHENTLRLSTEYCLETAHPHRVDDAIIRKAAVVVGDRLETDVRSVSCGTETSNLMKCSEDNLFPQSHFSCDYGPSFSTVIAPKLQLLEIYWLVSVPAEGDIQR